MLKRFPVNQSLLSKLASLSLEPTTVPADLWKKYLGVIPGLHSYLYHLRAIEEVLNDKNLFLSLPSDYNLQFATKGGVQFLVSIFYFLLENFLPSLVNLYAFRYMFKSLAALAYADRGKEGHFGTAEERDRLVSSVLSFVGMYQEANDPTSLPLSDPEFNRYWCKIVRAGLEFLGNFAAADPAVLDMLRKDSRFLSLLKNSTDRSHRVP